MGHFIADTRPASKIQHHFIDGYRQMSPFLDYFIFPYISLDPILTGAQVLEARVREVCEQINVFGRPSSFARTPRWEAELKPARASVHT